MWDPTIVMRTATARANPRMMLSECFRIIVTKRPPSPPESQAQLLSPVAHEAHEQGSMYVALHNLDISAEAGGQSS